MRRDGPSEGVALPLAPGKRRLAFGVVLSAAVGATMVFTVMPPLLPSIAAAFGGGRAGELSAQVALTMPSLGVLIGGALSGWILARIGMRACVAASMLMLGVFGAIAGLLGDIVSFAATRFVTGFASALMITGCITLLSSIYDDKERPKMIGYFKGTASAAGLPIGILTGVIAHEVGWRAPFALYALFAIVGTALALIGVPGKAVAAAEPGTGAGGRAPLMNLWPILLLIFFLQVPLVMGVTQFPFVLAQRGVVEPRMLSIVMSIGAIVVSAAAITSGHLQARFGAWPILLLGVALVAVGYGAVAISPTWQLATAASLVALLGCGLYFPQGLTLPIERVAPADRPKAIGLAQAAGSLSAFLNPLILAPLRIAFGRDGLYLAVAAIAATACLVGSLFFLQARSRNKQASGRAARAGPGGVP